MPRLILVIAVLWIAWPDRASAQAIYPIVQDRSVQASADSGLEGGPADAQSATAPDMGLWVEVVATSIVAPEQATFAGSASQYSEITGTSLAAFGATSSSLETPVYFITDPYPPGQVVATSRYRVQFAVTDPVTFDMVGSISAFGDALQAWCCDWYLEAVVTVRLDQLAGPTLFDDEAAVSLASGNWEMVTDDHDIEGSGELAAGIYELEVVATARLEPSYAEGLPEDPFLALVEAVYVIDTLFAPVYPDPSCEPADIDGDGDVDTADFAQLQLCFTGPGW